MEPTLTQAIEDMIATLEKAKADAIKADSGVKAAGPRVRKAMQDVKAHANTVRALALVAAKL